MINYRSSLKRLLLAGSLVALGSFSSLGQRSFGGTPLALDQGVLRSAESVHTVIPNFNPRDIEGLDSWGGVRDGRPLNVGKTISYQVDFAQDAELVASIEGHQVYRLMVQVEGTPVGIGLYYKHFSIPEGGRLYIYTPGGRQLLGAYTSETHRTDGAFATEPLSGNTLILDYEAPASGAMPNIVINEVAYFYRPALKAAAHLDSEDASDPGLKKFCQINANCPEGDGYQDQKASTVAFIINNQGDVGMCSGNLVNNLKGDFKPYVVSAAHCVSLTKEFRIPNMYMDQWITSFHYEKPRCSSGDYATPTEVSIVGARMKSFLPILGYSDGLLIELKEAIPDDYRVYYSGWDAAPTVWQKGAGLHHPAGDAMKVSVFDGGVRIATWNGSVGGRNDHLAFDFTQGNTEGGSSGSPLFNDKGLQVATLSGGAPGICVMDAVYGRMNSHFNKYKGDGSDGTKYMSKWLDPDNTGKTSVEGAWKNNYHPLRVVKELRGSVVATDASKVMLEWDAIPAHPQGYPISYTLYRNGKKLQTNLTGTSYEDTVDKSLTDPGQIEYAVEGVYNIEGKPTATSAARRVVYTGRLQSKVTPVVKQAATGLNITWDRPFNTQVVSKIDKRGSVALLKASASIKKNSFANVIINKVCFYDIYRLGRSPFTTPLYIHQINIVPTAATPKKADGQVDYDKATVVYARQRVGSKNYQAITLNATEEQARNKEWVAVPFAKPYEIVDGANLEVGCMFNPADVQPKAEAYIDTRSRDEFAVHDGVNLGFIWTPKNESQQFFHYGKYSPDRLGYQAVEIIISDNPKRPAQMPSEHYTRGKLPVPFPQVKQYDIYRNGTKIASVDANTMQYADAEGTSADKYDIEVIYDYPNELRPIDAAQISQMPQIYPAQFSDYLQVRDADAVEQIQIFNVTGQMVASFSPSDIAVGQLDVSSLPQGQYIAVIVTADGATTQKLTK